MQEYVDFLGRQSPYDRLDPEDLLRLARTIEVEFFAAGATVVEADEPELDHLYVVRTGTVQVLDRGRVVDELGPGDTFGHISVLSGLPPPLSVVAATEVLCYRVPDPRAVLAHPERLTFSHYNTMVTRPRLTSAALDPALRSVTAFMREPLWCEPDTPIREAARGMTESGHSCVLYRGTQGQLGIMTDSDCRRQVATGEVSVAAPVSRIGTVPVTTVDRTTTAAEAFVEMVLHGVHHLVVLDVGGRPLGVTRVVDLSSVEVRDPLRLRAEIDQARTATQLAAAASLLRPTAVELYDAGVPALRSSALVGAMVEAILERCVALEPETSPAGDHGGSAVDTSWLVLGSLGRREPLPWSDVDTGLVWAPRARDDGADAPDPRQLLQVAERALTFLESCGLARCPDGANASNPLFNRSHDAWLSAARHWIDHPESAGALLLSAIVADGRPVTGLALGRRATSSMERIATNRRFLQRMLDEALERRPPTGFVRDFVVEDSGEHRGQLDLKRGGLSPVVALGRWIAVTSRAPAASTQDRLRLGAESGLLTQDEADTLGAAHRDMFDLLYA